MLQNGTSPWVAIPAEKVTACCSAMPTSNARSGNSFIMMFKEEPEGIAGVIPIIFSFFILSINSWSTYQQQQYIACLSIDIYPKTRFQTAFQIMTDVAAVVAAAAGSRGIGFQGNLVSSICLVYLEERCVM